MANTTQRIYRTTDSITIPAGVFYVTVTTFYENKPLLASGFNLNFKSPYHFAYGAGYNGTGILGNGTITDSTVPVFSNPVGGTPNRFANLSAENVFGSIHGLNSTSNNSLREITWGNGAIGYLGNGGVTNRSIPNFTALTAPLKQIKTNSGYTVLNLSNTGNVYWYGQFNAPTNTSASSPVLIVGNVKIAKILSATLVACFLLDHNGYTYGIGNMTAGILGNGSSSGGTSSPVLVLGAGAGGYKFIKANTNFGSATNSYALTNDNRLFGWGQNLGYLGNNTIISYSSPVLIANNVRSFSIFDAEEVGSGANSYAYIDLDNNAYMWGQNSVGELGNGDLTFRSSPTLISGNLKFLKIVSNSGATLGLTTNNDLYGWGNNNTFALGGGYSNTVKFSSPVLISSGLKFRDFFISINMAVYAITREGVMYAWGQNSFGELGVGSTGNISTPTLVAGTWTPNFIGNSANGLSTVSTQILPVNPGNTYDVLLSAGTSYFGNTPISYGEIDRIVVTYET